MKLCPEGAELFHEDRQTDTTKLTVTFHKFANVPKKPKVLYFLHHHGAKQFLGLFNQHRGGHE